MGQSLPGSSCSSASDDPAARLNAMQETYQLFSRVYPGCRELVSENIWQLLTASAESLELFADILSERATDLNIPGYLGELARMELYVYRLATECSPVPQYSENPILNPTLELFDNSWKNLACRIENEAGCPAPEKGAEHCIVWLHPISGGTRVKAAQAEDLLAMKMALEGLSVQAAAREAECAAGVIGSALTRALQDGIVIGPEPLIKREYNPEHYKNIDHSYFTARIFSLQWHITQNCDLHCRHCYDRSHFKTLSLEQERDILADLDRFCASHNVQGQVTFTGGNPLLHPDFETLYQEAVDRGFTTAILGNPASREQVERLSAMQPPAFYQVSLEGLEAHNDYMRGKGHFKKVLAFLQLLRELEIFSMVMLTLTRDNMEQVLPLAELLRGKSDLFTFNRLSSVGEGAKLAGAPLEKYAEFLRAYDERAAANPSLGSKDNLLNILYHRQKKVLSGGCTGYGCGAAFNFLTVLADGSVHACRKFPSLLGNILQNSLSEIYHREKTRQYRAGAAECRGCAIRPVCGGCLAVAHSSGHDIFTRKDPYCFFDAKDSPC
jgi:selenobiotic family peptide radical SAM maturase